MYDTIDLRVCETGRRTVIDFGEHDYLGLHSTQYRRELQDLIDCYDVEVLAIDMSGVGAISSEVFGTLAWLLTRVKVEVLNPSDVVREVLEATRLDERIEIIEHDPATA